MPRSLPSVDRRTILKTLGVGVTAPLFFSSASRLVGAAGEPWTVAVLPDTQKYTMNSSDIAYAHDQTEWIVNNRSTENIQFVTHVGDLVEDADDTDEWDRIDAVMSKLDGVVPYSTLPGNHDWVVEPRWNDPRTVENYRSYFGPSRYEGYSWYKGSGPDGLSHYQIFSAGGYEFLHLALEWEVPGRLNDSNTPFGWAHKVLQQYPDHPTIITTHSYLTAKGARQSGVQGDWGNTSIGGEPDPNRDQGNSGETIWKNLIKPNSQVFMVLNGHFVSGNDCEDTKVSTNDEGLEVYQIMADYQDRPNGGDGWMRLMSFEPGGGSGGTDRIQVRTYSPSKGKYETDSDSQFSFDLSFADRFASRTEETRKGDVNDDGVVDQKDLNQVQKKIADPDVNLADESAADMDDDDDIDISDAVAIRNEIRGESS